MASSPTYSVFGVTHIPEVRPGDDLSALIHDALLAQATPLDRGDVLLVTQKIVSKAEGRMVALDTVEPSDRARTWAAEWDRDPRAVEIVLQESRSIVRMERGVIIAETRHGWICANAGVDQSNVGGGDTVTLLPLDPSASAQRIRAGLRQRGQPDVPVIVTDTFGRPWRMGLTNVAIGLSGMQPMRSYVGEYDAEGYDLRVTIMAWADELASAAELVMNKLDRIPVVVVRGLNIPVEEADHMSLVRPPDEDLFR